MEFNNPTNDAMSHFDSETVTAMVEFTKVIAAAEGDHTICMARKASRLYDLLVTSGCPSAKRMPLHHYFLEHSMHQIRGKRITLVDDTVILGTTLGKTKRLLMENGAKSVETVVLATDRDHWSKELIMPDHVFLDFDHRQMIALCAAEVQALGHAAIPYLSDFPFFEEFVVTNDNFSRMQGQFSWEVVPISRRLDLNGHPHASSFSILPSGTIERSIDRIFGHNVAHCIEIVKVRCFSIRNEDGKHRVRLVPIVTFAPLGPTAIERLFETLIEKFEEVTQSALTSIRDSFGTHMSKLRFCQYLTSCIVGTLYVDHLKSSVAIRKTPEPTLIEAVRIFGPWVRNDLKKCHDALTRFSEIGLSDATGAGGIKQIRLPLSVSSVSKEECRSFLNLDIKGASAPLARSLRSDLEKLFTQLYTVHELPAREEVKSHGKAIFSVPASQVPHRDRLKNGLDWKTISAAVLEREGLADSPKRKARLSALLDQLVDDGIAVPVLSCREDVYFRAYRHGEDVEFANQEPALAYDIADGFLETSGKSSITRLTLEKLLVSLLRIGAQKRFLAPIHGLNGSNGGVARVGYHLHGAVVSLPSDDSPLADSSESWLSKFLVEEGVLKVGEDRSYSLGKRPDASTITLEASSDAKQLGNILGVLITQKTSTGKPALTERELVLLTTCPQPRHVALAAVAELKIMLEGIHKRISKWKRLQLNEQVCSDLLKQLRSDKARTAAFSAAMKISAHRTGRVQKILDESTDFLNQIQLTGPFLAKYWRSAWTPIVADQDGRQSEYFDKWLSELSHELSDLTLGLLTLEIALASGISKAKGRKKSQFSSSSEVIQRLLPDLTPSPEAQKLLVRLRKTLETKQPVENIEQTVRFAIDFCLKRQHRGHSLVRNVCEVNAGYGRVDRRTDFKYVLWYDIIDSTGQKSNLRGDEIRDYRNSVRRFKDEVNSHLGAIALDAKKRGITLYPWGGDIYSKDDEKNIFFSGPRCITVMTETLRVISNEARAKGVKLRYIVMNTDLAGYPAHKFDQSPAVEGEAFWEHSSRVKQKLKSKEKAEIQCSYLWLADQLAETNTLEATLSDLFAEVECGEVNTTIENYPLETKFRGGEMA